MPLLRRAYELWFELERQAGQKLLTITGSLEMGPPGSEAVEDALASCREHDIPHEMLTAAEYHAALPGLPAARSLLRFAAAGRRLPRPRGVHCGPPAARQSLGAELRTNERVLAWEPQGDVVRVRTDRGVYAADRLIITAGAWLPKVAPAFAIPCQTRAQRACVVPAAPARAFEPDRFPVFIFDDGEAGCYYGFPMHGLPGLKIGKHHHFREVVDPDTLDRTPREQDEAVLRVSASRYFPDGAGDTLRMATCLYTNTPDGHFIVDFHPDCSNVIVGGGFSGHGYKFCSVVGEVLADLALDGATRHDVGLFKAARFD